MCNNSTLPFSDVQYLNALLSYTFITVLEIIPRLVYLFSNFNTRTHTSNTLSIKKRKNYCLKNVVVLELHEAQLSKIEDFVFILHISLILIL